MDLLALAGRVVLSLAVVLAVLWIAARGLRRGQRRSKRGIAVEVLARQPLAQRSSVAVVQVGDRALVLGVTEHRVELLAEQPVESLLRAADPEVAPVLESIATEARAEPSGGGETPAAQPASWPTAHPRPQQATQPSGPLAGSALSPATWSKALDAVRELTVRK
jgi:flagellar protein FliO/FliZ